MRFLKVFLSAVSLFAFFNAHAQPITGFLGYKFGQYIPWWAEGTTGHIEVVNFKDDFFDRLEISATPESKKLYSISAFKALAQCEESDELEALTQLLKDKYEPGLYKLDPRLETTTGSNYTFRVDGKWILLQCVGRQINLRYNDLELYKKVEKELQSIKQKRTDALKEKIDSSKL